MNHTVPELEKCLEMVTANELDDFSIIRNFVNNFLSCRKKKGSTTRLKCDDVIKVYFNILSAYANHARIFKLRYEQCTCIHN